MALISSEVLFTDHFKIKSLKNTGHRIYDQNRLVNCALTPSMAHLLFKITISHYRFLNAA